MGSNINSVTFTLPTITRVARNRSSEKSFRVFRLSFFSRLPLVSSLACMTAGLSTHGHSLLFSSLFSFFGCRFRMLLRMLFFIIQLLFCCVYWTFVQMLCKCHTHNISTGHMIVYFAVYLRFLHPQHSVSLRGAYTHTHTSCG